MSKDKQKEDPTVFCQISANEDVIVCFDKDENKFHLEKLSEKLREMGREK